MLRFQSQLSLVRVTHHDHFAISGDQSRVLVIEALTATNLCHIFELSWALLLEFVVTPANSQIVMSQCKPVIISALDLLDILPLEYLLHVNLGQLRRMVPFARDIRVFIDEKAQIKPGGNVFESTVDFLKLVVCEMITVEQHQVGSSTRNLDNLGREWDRHRLEDLVI